MTDLFLRVFNLSISGCWLILAVLAVRFFLRRRAPGWVLPLLWGLVGLRLVCPFSVESALSLLPSSETLSPETVHFDPAPTITSGVPLIDEAMNPVISETFAAREFASVNPLDITASVFAALWLLGVAGMLVYALVSMRRLRRRVRDAAILGGGVCESARVDSPFILGVLRPRIYLPVGMDGETAALVLAHERAHLARGDHWWKLLGYLVLCVHWFDPLVWLAYALFCRDIELACDERVVRTLDAARRADYSQALLSCAAPRRAVAVCPLAFGEVDVKTRIRSVLSYKKPAVRFVALALVALAVLAVCFLTDPQQENALPSPFDRSYRIAEVVYTAPEYDFDTTITRFPVLIELNAQREPELNIFRTHGALGSGDVTYWADDMQGFPQETTLRRVKQYLRADDAGWVDGLSMEKLIDENHAVWQFGIGTAEENGLACEFFLLQQEDGTLYLASRVSGSVSTRGLRWVFRLRETDATDTADTLAPVTDEVFLLQADLTGDGENERIYYAKLGGGDYRLRVLDGGTELYSAELGTPHVGWDSFFLYGEGDSTAILHYSPWVGQGFYSCSYELFDYRGGEKRVLAANSIEIDTNPNGDTGWTAAAEAFADEVNALLDQSVLLISTLDSEFVTAAGSGAQFHWIPPEEESGAEDEPQSAQTATLTRESILAGADSSLEHGGWLWYTADGALYRWNGGAAEKICALPENEAGAPVLAELSAVDGCAALSYHVGGATMGHYELLLFDESGAQTARYIHGGVIAVSGGVAVTASFAPMPAVNNLSISRDGGESWESLGDSMYCYGVSVTTDGEQTTYTSVPLELRDGWVYTRGVYDLDAASGAMLETKSVRVRLSDGATEVLD